MISRFTKLALAGMALSLAASFLWTLPKSPPDAGKAKLDFMLENHGNSIESVDVAEMAEGAISYRIRYRAFGSSAPQDALLRYTYHRGTGWKLKRPALGQAEASP